MVDLDNGVGLESLRDSNSSILGLDRFGIWLLIRSLRRLKCSSNCCGVGGAGTEEEEAVRGARRGILGAGDLNTPGPVGSARVRGNDGEEEVEDAAGAGDGE